MKFVRVTAPYVTLKARDAAGAWVVRGMYKGGTLPAADVDPDSLQHHLDSELVEVFTAAAPEPEPTPEPVKAEEPEATKAAEPKKATPAKKSAA